MGQIVPRRALLGALGGVLVASLATLLAWSSLASAERPAVAPEVHIPTAVASLDAKGGELAHLGATLRVPAGALRAPETLAMASAPLPGPLRRGAPLRRGCSKRGAWRARSSA
jgi:hypothetical protein